MNLARLPLLLLVFVAALAAAPGGAAPVEAILKDGTPLPGERVSDIHGERPQLDGRELFDRDNPVRAIRDPRQAIRRGGMYVQMTGGDVLPGRIVRWTPGSPEAPATAQFHVALEGPGDLRSGIVAVRADCVARVYSAGASISHETPGLVVARDGRRGIARSLKFTAAGVEALTESGVLAIDFADLAVLHLTAADPVGDVLRHAVWSSERDPHPLARIVTAGGAELTYARDLAVLAQVDSPRRGQNVSEQLAIRPVWALESLFIHPAAIVSTSYRDAEEVPLSLLPGQTLQQRSVFHAWPWRRNASVGGGRLESGGRWAELGVGMHSHSAVAFTLPPGAREFSTWVGLNSAAGAGGCVQCRIHRDGLDGPALWESGFLRGGDEPLFTGALHVDGAAKLVLVVEFGHEGRPAGADPWDLRDEVDWLDPIVTVDRSQIPTPESEPERWIPQLAGWEIPAEMQRRLSLRPFWDQYQRQWTVAMSIGRGDAAPFELTRRLQVDLTNAVLPVAAANENRGRTRHAIYVKVDGDTVDSTMNGVLHTQPARRNEVPGREWSLGAFREKSVQLSVLIEPLRPSGDPVGLIWQSLGPRPLVENLPPGGRPATPDVPLTSLTPLAAVCQGSPIELQAGRLADGSPLEIRGWQFDDGFGVPTGSEITYRVDPHWRRFVAILGLAKGWQGAGPYSILLDGQPHWECSIPAIFTRHSPALQIDVPIPAGCQTLTLRVAGQDSHAAWACAGFVE
jgi:hypothetical protein